MLVFMPAGAASGNGKAGLTAGFSVRI